MVRRLLLSLISLSVLTQGCAPFVDARREAGSPATVGLSTPSRVAICYNGLSANENQLIRMAREECAKTDSEPAYDGHSYWSCRVFVPHRVFYRCQPKPDEKP